ncbi:MAG: hypothetical protein IKI57_06790 [Clostridia bacterium]|nr:hypothetical protein [Clostridia bacterium]
MANLSNENIEKLRMLREKLISEGSIIDYTEEETKQVVLSKEEEVTIEKTMNVWGINKEQAIMIYKTSGSLKALEYVNKIREWQQENKITYAKMSAQMKDDKTFIENVEELESRYYKNYEDILSNELTVAEIYILRNTNKNFEKLLAERRPQLDQRINRYHALGTVVYYGQIVDQLKIKEHKVTMNEKEYENSKLLPSIRNIEVTEIGG